MQKLVKKLFLSVSTVIFLSLSADAIRCYQCTSVNDTRCADLKADNSSIELNTECNGDYGGKEPFCRKVTLTIIDEEKTVRIRRSCGWEEDPLAKPCYKYESDFHIEVVCVCHTDGCNAAAAVPVHAPLLLAPLLLAVPPLLGA